MIIIAKQNKIINSTFYNSYIYNGFLLLPLNGSYGSKEYLNEYFGSVLQLLKGFNKVSGNQPEMVSIISKIAYARDVEDFSEYRKAILDACGLVDRIKESDPNA